jgi:hypothetical protein
VSVDTIQSDLSSPSPRRESNTRFSRRRLVIISLMIAIIVGGGGVAIWLLQRPPAPTGEPVKVAKYIASPQFQTLADSDKRPYMDALREGKEEIAEAYARKQITAPEYENALLNAWIARTLKHVDEFAKLRDGKPRQQMLDRIITKGEKKRTATTRPTPSIIYSQDPYELASVKTMVAAWPAERQAQWNEFRDALRKGRQERGVPVNSGIWY